MPPLLVDTGLGVARVKNWRHSCSTIVDTGLCVGYISVVIVVMVITSLVVARPLQSIGQKRPINTAWGQIAKVSKI